MTLPLSFAIAAPTATSLSQNNHNSSNEINDPTSIITTSITPLFETSSKQATNALWNNWLSTGSLEQTMNTTTTNNNYNHEFSVPCSKGVSIASAMAQSFHLKPGETKQVVFSLSWDMPKVTFAEQNTYYRRYTDFFW